MNIFEETYKELKELIENNSSIFKLQNNYKISGRYFPDYVKELLENYEKLFSSELNDIINKKASYLYDEKDLILNNIKTLNKIIINTINSYYSGKQFEANQIFSEGLKKVFPNNIQYETEIPRGKTFFRARLDKNIFFESKDLFHIDFKIEH